MNNRSKTQKVAETEGAMGPTTMEERTKLYTQAKELREAEFFGLARELVQLAGELCEDDEFRTGCWKLHDECLVDMAIHGDVGPRPQRKRLAKIFA